MRTKYQINTTLSIKEVTNGFSKYTGVFLGKIRIAAYLFNIKRVTGDPNLYTVHSAVRNIHLGDCRTVDEALKLCIEEAKLTIERLSSND